MPPELENIGTPETADSSKSPEYQKQKGVLNLISKYRGVIAPLIIGFAMQGDVSKPKFTPAPPAIQSSTASGGASPPEMPPNMMAA